mmetsp:Transcript_22339/g.16800  ORF Transcript_22339/g.16800 Transcript_22339/m.16800 type:complete len:100 (+) Transcript_22339:1110-1409(+)
MKEAIEVVTAAMPTRAWKAATVCGNSVTSTLYPSVSPTAVAAPSNAIAYANTGAGRCREASAVMTPPSTPMMPIALPMRAVFWAESPEMPPMQQRELNK